MDFKEKMDRLEGIFAYDTGCYCGIKDEGFKDYLRDNLDEAEGLLTGVAKSYLNSDYVYMIEDVAKLLQWAEDELELKY